MCFEPFVCSQLVSINECRESRPRKLFVSTVAFWGWFICGDWSAYKGWAAQNVPKSRFFPLWSPLVLAFQQLYKINLTQVDRLDSRFPGVVHLHRLAQIQRLGEFKRRFFPLRLPWCSPLSTYMNFVSFKLTALTVAFWGWLICRDWPRYKAWAAQKAPKSTGFSLWSPPVLPLQHLYKIGLTKVGHIDSGLVGMAHLRGLAEIQRLDCSKGAKK